MLIFGIPVKAAVNIKSIKHEDQYILAAYHFWRSWCEWM